MTTPILSLSIRRFLAEIVIVVLGVLIALAVDNWRDQRRERGMEQIYLKRIVVELQRDTAEIHERLRDVPKIVAALDFALREMSDEDQVRDTAALLKAIIESTPYAWVQSPPHAATFEDLKSTGNLGLIKDDSLRDAIVKYYFNAHYVDQRVDTRRPGYGAITYRLLPRGTTEFSVSDSLTAEERLKTVKRLRDANLIPDILAERNFIKFFGQMQTIRLRRAETLLHELGA